MIENSCFIVYHYFEVFVRWLKLWMIDAGAGAHVSYCRVKMIGSNINVLININTNVVDWINLTRRSWNYRHATWLTSFRSCYDWLRVTLIRWSNNQHGWDNVLTNNMYTWSCHYLVNIWTNVVRITPKIRWLVWSYEGTCVNLIYGHGDW